MLLQNEVVNNDDKTVTLEQIKQIVLPNKYTMLLGNLES